jgi:hypothetical protein
MRMPEVCVFTSIARPLHALGSGRPGATSRNTHLTGWDLRDSRPRIGRSSSRQRAKTAGRESKSPPASVANTGSPSIISNAPHSLSGGLMRVPSQELGNQMGGMDYAAVSVGLRRFDSRLKQDRKMRGAFKNIVEMFRCLKTGC